MMGENKMYALYMEAIQDCIKYRKCHNVTKYVAKIIEAKNPLLIIQLRQEFKGEDRFVYLFYFDQESNLKRCRFKMPTEPEQFRKRSKYSNKSSEENRESDSQYYSRCLTQANYYVTRICSENFEDYVSKPLITETITKMINNSGPKTLERFKHIHAEIAKRYEVLESLVSNINYPIIGRSDGNNKNFDWITIEVELMYKGRTKEQQMQYILTNKDILTSKVLSKLESSAVFKSFEIPIECMELSNVIYRHDNVLEYTFDLKKELRELEEEVI